MSVSSIIMNENIANVTAKLNALAFYKSYSKKYLGR